MINNTTLETNYFAYNFVTCFFYYITTTYFSYTICLQWEKDIIFINCITRDKKTGKIEDMREIQWR